MIEMNDQQMDRFRKLVGSLNALLESLDSPIVVPPQIAKAVAEKVAKRICLVCGKPWDDGHSRGLCEEHYQEAQYKIRENPAIARELIMKGQLTEKGKPGRRRTKKSAFDDSTADESRLEGTRKDFNKKTRRSSGKDSVK